LRAIDRWPRVESYAAAENRKQKWRPGAGRAGNVCRCGQNDANTRKAVGGQLPCEPHLVMRVALDFRDHEKVHVAIVLHHALCIGAEQNHAIRRKGFDKPLDRLLHRSR
jgi:hypothetical protein